VKHSLGLDFPNLPYMLDGDVKITESTAIMRYLANQYGPKDFSGKDENDKALVDMIFGVVSDIKSASTRHMYATGDKQAITELSHGMEAASKFLGEKQFIVGDYLTWVDFFVWEQIEMLSWITDGEFLTRYPNFAAYHKRIGALPKFSEYIASDRFMKGPFNNKSAKLNN